ncbi:alpha/beta fold hydrolase [Tropicibacter naphthalenivorans]|uniref:Haloacetate dehalogenase H-1 n=1 Tax=Tropicibacter naphthalenivorans TaxID=441103 RepID=A0A0P1GJD3_9RHOB|nr:alpha/beta hydrolase [Tropicibacter naphthalenivorans]CUH82036.1 Haloacetate dehalogenase H-1 [Tropicibacter naphthalenivorans]SMD08268.1 Pimeloyl-ACP methyl ester carboxylesterase [Tropicibacter naphthalenivorans]
MLDLPNTAQIAGNAVKWGRMGRGPAMVAIHGTPFSSQVWRRIIPSLAEHRTVYYFDLVGYGQSEMRAGQDVSLGVQNEVLAALMDEWQLDRPDVLAHDFGGATALRGWYLNGLRYGSLTIFDAVALAPWGSPFVQHVRQHEAAFAGMPDYMHRAMLRAYLQTAAHQPLSEEAHEVYAAPWLGPVGQPAFYRQIAQMDQRFTDEVEPLYGAMDCPVTVLWGEQDAWIPIERGQELARRISDRPIIRVPGAGHLIQDDRPEAIVAAVLGMILGR